MAIKPHFVDNHYYAYIVSRYDDDDDDDDAIAVCTVCSVLHEMNRTRGRLTD